MSYTKPTLAGYNANPPPDDGSEVAANEVRWSTHKTKIGDPLKNYADAINQGVEDAFASQFLNAVTAISAAYSVQASDRGKVLNVSNGAALTLPAAASVGSGFSVVVRNANGDSVIVSGAEQINGRSSYSIAEGAFSVFVSNGVAWAAVGRSAQDPVVIDDGTNVRVTGLGFGTSGQFSDWLGPRPANGNIDLCSEATATSYRKVNGEEFSRGRVLDGVFTNTGQSTSTLGNASITVGPFATEGNPRTVSVSYVYGRSRDISDAAAFSGSAGATLVLETSADGVTWTQVGDSESFVGTITSADDGQGVEEPGVLAEQISGSFVRVDASVAVTETRYRARITSRTTHSFTSTPIGPDTVNQLIDLISVE